MPSTVKKHPSGACTPDCGSGYQEPAWPYPDGLQCRPVYQLGEDSTSQKLLSFTFEISLDIISTISNSVTGLTGAIQHRFTPFRRQFFFQLSDMALYPLFLMPMLTNQDFHWGDSDPIQVQISKQVYMYLQCVVCYIFAQ